MATHIPYTSLPKSIISSGCKIIYIFRDPKDVIVSLWHFSQKLSPEGVQTSTPEDLDFFFFFFENEIRAEKYSSTRKSNKTKVLMSGGTASIQTNKGNECLALWAKACAIALLCHTT